MKSPQCLREELMWQELQAKIAYQYWRKHLDDPAVDNVSSYHTYGDYAARVNTLSWVLEQLPLWEEWDTLPLSLYARDWD
jgi:hypothetical protein